MKKITFLLMFVMTIMLANATTTRYIKVIATGTGDGTSWSNAAGTADIQIQIDAVALDATKGEVQFAAGTYLVSAALLIRDGVNLTGGYAADGSGIRDLYNNQTILDGQNNKKLINASDANTVAAFTKITTINGFIIQRGSASYGSAVYITYGVVLQNCVIRNNNGSTYGAAIMAKRTQSIATNSAGWNMSCALINCIIVNNTSSNYAAGIWIDQDAHFSMINCIVANNKSTDATNGIGGLYVGANIRYSRITNNIFYNNTSAVTATNRNNYYSPTTNNAGIFSNYFSDATIPAGGATAAAGNKTSTDFASPGFVSPTSFQGYATDAGKTTELSNSDWRLTSASSLIGLGISTANADMPYPFSMTVFGGVNKLYSSIGTDIMGSNRIIGIQPEMGAYEYNPVVVTASSSDNAMGTAGCTIVSKGSSVTVVATPTSGYHFVTWIESGSVVSTNSTYTFTASITRTLVANFEPNTLNISSGTTNATAITCTTCDITVASGAELTIGADKTLKSVTIAAGGKLTITAGVLTATNGITLESDYTGTATINDSYTEPTINAVVKQQVDAGRNWYISSPISTGNSSVLNRGDSVVQYNEGLKKWEKVTGSLTSGRGYIQAAVATHGTTGTVDFSGLTNSGTIPVIVSRTESGLSRGFNLVGNPYPSYLDWSLVITDPLNVNISSTFWYRTKNTDGAYVFVTQNGTSGEVVGGTTANTTITKFIPPMQAFWVRENSNIEQTTYNTSITFKNSMREHRDKNGNILKAPKQSDRMRLRLQVTDGVNSDELLLYFDTNAQNSFDNYDSPKMFNNVAAKPEIFTKADDEKLVINGMKEIPYDTEIPLGFVTGQTADYSISRTEMMNFDLGTLILLKDKQNSATEFDLSQGESYNFSSQPTTTTTDRFSLIFCSAGTATNLKNTESPKVQVFVNNQNKITIIAEKKATYSIFNAMGQKQYENVINATKITIDKLFCAGVYFVDLTVNGQREIQKVIIR